MAALEILQLRACAHHLLEMLVSLGTGLLKEPGKVFGGVLRKSAVSRHLSSTLPAFIALYLSLSSASLALFSRNGRPLLTHQNLTKILKIQKNSVRRETNPQIPAQQMGGTGRDYKPGSGKFRKNQREAGAASTFAVNSTSDHPG